MPTDVAGVLLAGGQSRRMGGGDKCLRPLGGEPILGHVIRRAEPQVSALMLSANGDPARFRDYGLPVVADVILDDSGGSAGPLAGILSGLRWAAASAPACRWLASFPTDAPFMPRDLVARMAAALEAEGAEMACAASAGRANPVVGLWPLCLVDELERAMVEEAMRKIDIWTARYRLTQVEFGADPLDPFFNTNRPEDLEEAERRLAG